MADVYVGVGVDEVAQPGGSDNVRIRLLLADDSDPTVGKTGIAFDAAGMTVAYSKHGASSFTAFPTFDTNNWDEIGYGWYDLIIRGSDGTEQGLLDTAGPILFYVICTATKAAHILKKVVPADAARDDQWTDARAARIDANISSRHASGAAVASVAGAVGSVTGAVGSVAGNVGGSVASSTATDALIAALNNPTVAQIVTGLLEGDWQGYEATCATGTKLGDALAGMRGKLLGAVTGTGATKTHQNAANDGALFVVILTDSYATRGAPT